jgi:hypothetical protein
MNEAFKFFKTKEKTPDLTGVIDCSEKDNDKVIARTNSRKIALQFLCFVTAYRNQN